MANKVVSDQESVLFFPRTRRPEKVAVVGAGGWGTALAVLLGKEVLQGRKHLNVCLWVRRESLAERIRKEKVNVQYLPGVEIPSLVKVSSSIGEVVSDAKLVVVVVPSQYLRGVATEMKPYLGNEAIVCSASKGIEIGTFKRMSEVLHEETHIPKKNIAVVSGPSHAEEVGIGKATAIVAASCSVSTAIHAQEILSAQNLRIYTSKDIKGVEYGGALKNIIAIKQSL